MLCVSAGCGDSDNCGPTSDWPFCGGGDDDNASSGSGRGGDQASGDDSSDDSAKAPSDGTNKPAGPPKSSGGSTTANGASDAGVLGIMDAATGSSSTPSRSDAAADGGVPDASPDAALGPRSCSLAGGVDAGMCDGGVCASSLRAPVGACAKPDDLALACSGQIASVVAACAEDDVLGLGTGRSVAMCARRDPGLGAASPDCIDCYVEEVLCAAQNCLVPCLAGFSEECRLCRLAFCGEALQSCSGLYVPAELTNPANDAGL